VAVYLYVWLTTKAQYLINSFAQAARVSALGGGGAGLQKAAD
jgi:hypothetical protein